MRRLPRHPGTTPPIEGLEAGAIPVPRVSEGGIDERVERISPGNQALEFDLNDQRIAAGVGPIMFGQAPGAIPGAHDLLVAQRLRRGVLELGLAGHRVVVGFTLEASRQAHHAELERSQLGGVEGRPVDLGQAALAQGEPHARL